MMESESEESERSHFLLTLFTQLCRLQSGENQIVRVGSFVIGLVPLLLLATPKI